MLKNISATRKGLITGVLMVALSLVLYYSKLPLDSPFQYIIYVLYAGGIIWTVYDFSLAADGNTKFGAYFTQAFKCFIVVTLLMVAFTFIFNKLHPEFRDQMAVEYKKELLKKGSSTPAEVEAGAEKMKSFYIVMLVSGTVFGYLIIGAIVSLLTSLLFSRRK
jgi:hypothetical protein